MQRLSNRLLAGLMACSVGCAILWMFPIAGYTYNGLAFHTIHLFLAVLAGALAAASVKLRNLVAVLGAAYCIQVLVGLAFLIHVVPSALAEFDIPDLPGLRTHDQTRWAAWYCFVTLGMFLGLGVLVPAGQAVIVGIRTKASAHSAVLPTKDTTNQST